MNATQIQTRTYNVLQEASQEERDVGHEGVKVTRERGETEKSRNTDVMLAGKKTDKKK